jgi:SAM-dependent methyltransferase
MTRFYDKTENRLVFVARAASSAFWDDHWQSEKLRQLIERGNGFVVRETKRYLPAGARVLEGGCGRANTVWGLHKAGFQAAGVDFAERTVAAVNNAAPELDVQVEDVRRLSFPDASFDGYWSLGVIEHFYDGFDPILEEMWRVLRPDGYLFMTVPAMSPLRHLKARLGLYARYEETPERIDGFYQFALDPARVIARFEKRGFKLVHRSGMDGIKGLKDEISFLKGPLQRLYDTPGAGAARVKRLLNRVLAPTYHMAYYVMRRP